MGGSFALALKRAGLVRRVVGFSPSEATRQRALSMGVLDAALPSISGAVQGSDLLLLAVPVAATESSLLGLQGALESGALLMDVGSTKRDVVQAAERALGTKLPQFVPAHPIAGKEVAGVAHADVDLYQGCQVILTPSAATDAAQTAVWRDILLANKDQLLLQSAHLRDSLQAFEAALQTGDAAALQALIAKASATRAAWPHSNHDTD